jgi:hypothetical protein
MQRHVPAEAAASASDESYFHGPSTPYGIDETEYARYAFSTKEVT